jgi:hypothetical protein
MYYANFLQTQPWNFINKVYIEGFVFLCEQFYSKQRNKLRGLNPRENYTDGANDTCQQS